MAKCPACDDTHSIDVELPDLTRTTADNILTGCWQSPDSRVCRNCPYRVSPQSTTVCILHDYTLKRSDCWAEGPADGAREASNELKLIDLMGGTAWRS